MNIIVNINVIMITKTVHTAGIFSFSMYRYLTLTQPVDGIPNTNAETKDYKAFRLFKNLIRKESIPRKSSKIE